MSEDKQSTTQKPESPLDGSDQFAVRQAKLEQMRENGFDPFRANWSQSHTSTEAQALLTEDLEGGPEVSVAGRIVAFRLMGKASFLKILDRDGRMQAYVRKDEIGDDEYVAFKKLDLGDFIGVRGKLFRTKTGEVIQDLEQAKQTWEELRKKQEVKDFFAGKTETIDVNALADEESSSESKDDETEVKEVASELGITMDDLSEVEDLWNSGEL